MRRGDSAGTPHLESLANMPRLRTTPEASDIIAKGKAAGRSSRDIQKDVKDQTGIDLDQRTISRYTKKLGVEKPGSSLSKTKPSKPDAKSKASKPRASRKVPVLDEIPALQREAARLQQILGLTIPNSDRAKVTAELRSCFKAIRGAELAKAQRLNLQSSEAQKLLATLERVAAENGEPQAMTISPSEEATPDPEPVVADTNLVHLPKTARA